MLSDIGNIDVMLGRNPFHREGSEFSKPESQEGLKA